MKKVIEYVTKKYRFFEILFLVVSFLILILSYIQTPFDSIFYTITLVFLPIHIGLLYLLIASNLGYHTNEREKRDNQTDRREVSGDDI